MKKKIISEYDFNRFKNKSKKLIKQEIADELYKKEFSKEELILLKNYIHSLGQIESIEDDNWSDDNWSDDNWSDDNWSDDSFPVDISMI